MTTSLVKYNAARLALQQACAVDEVRNIKDRAEALRHYAMQIGDVAMQNWMVEIKIRAGRRAGQIIEEMLKEGTIRAQGSPKGPGSGPLPPTFHDVGVGRHEGQEWQRWASVPEDLFEGALETAKAGGSVLTSAAVKRIVLPPTKAYVETVDKAATALVSKWRALADDRGLPPKDALSRESRRELSYAARVTGEWLLKIASFFEEVSA